MSLNYVEKLKKALRKEARYLVFEKTLKDQQKRIEELEETVEAYKEFKDKLVEQLLEKEAEIQRLKEIALEVGL